MSDLYYDPTREAGLELKATMLNINKGHNRELMESCQILNDYSEFTALVRKYTKMLSLNQAVERAVDECIARGILGDFLRKNKEEVCHMCIYEYDEERHMRQEREYFMEKGMEKGRTEGAASTLLDVLGLIDSVPVALREKILATEDPDLLSRWILIAARASSIADFEEKIKA